MSADNHVFWNLEADIKEDKLEDLKSLMATMVEATRADEPGTLNYEWFVSEDGMKCHIHERYADSGAVLTHLGNFGTKYAKDFMDALDIKRFTVYGNPDETARGALTKVGAQFMSPLDGFVR
ncbi:MAG: antibiotic biosynthesis monooxygenase [Chlorobi bacterium]|nr:antibiotic biosynthesis monooxygenase [Chlorobiota bacterium]